MTLLDLDKYDDESKSVLTNVIKAVREQYIVNGQQKQFWFYPCQISDATLTPSVVEKWIQALRNNNLLYYYKLYNSFEFEQNLALVQQGLGDNHSWDAHMFMPFIYGFPAPPASPCLALDIGDTNLDQLLELVSKTALGVHFYVDRIGNIYFDNTPLSIINSSASYKAVLIKILEAKHNTVTAEEVTSVLEPLTNTNDINQKRNEVISDIRKELFSVSQHKLVLESSKSGHRVDYYSLVLHE